MARRAFIAGIEHYPCLDPAEGAVASAGLIRDVTAAAGFRPGDIRCPSEVELDKAALTNGLGWLVDGARRGDSVLFYFMGHGVPGDDTGYLCAYPYDGTSVGELLSGEELKRAFAGLPEGVEAVVVLDACNSGSSLPPPPSETPDGPPEESKRSLDDVVRPAGSFLDPLVKVLSGSRVAVVAACEADEYANSAPMGPNGVSYGVLTFCLARELTSGAGGRLDDVMEGVCKAVLRWMCDNHPPSQQHPVMAGAKGICTRAFLKAFDPADPFDGSRFSWRCRGSCSEAERSISADES